MGAMIRPLWSSRFRILISTSINILKPEFHQPNFLPFTLPGDAPWVKAVQGMTKNVGNPHLLKRYRFTIAQKVKGPQH
jgi:hypothetical protein